MFELCTHRYFICNSIGFAIAERLAADGASVVVSSRKENNVTNAVEKLKASGYSVSGVVCHVSKASDRERLIKEAQDKFGGIDILVSNAAVNPGVGPVLEVMYWVILSLYICCNFIRDLGHCFPVFLRCRYIIWDISQSCLPFLFLSRQSSCQVPSSRSPRFCVTFPNQTDMDASEKVKVFCYFRIYLLIPWSTSTVLLLLQLICVTTCE